MGTRTVSSTGAARTRRALPEAIRQMFRDAAMEMADGGDDQQVMDDPMPQDADGDNHTHIHIHGAQGEGAVPPAAAEAAPPQDPVEARFQALEGQMSQIMEMLQSMAGGGQEEGEAEGDPSSLTGTEESTGGQADGEQNPADAGSEGGGNGDKSNDDEITKDGKRAMTGDSVALETSFKSLLADAEILVPGFRLPTFDGAKTRKSTIDSMCAMRKRVLDHLNSHVEGAQLLTNMSGGKTYSSATFDCNAATVLFRSSASAKRLLNNAASTRDANKAPSRPASVTQNGAVGKITSIAELNELNRKHYAARDAALAAK